MASKWDKLRSGYFSEGMREKAIELAAPIAGRVAADIGAGTGFVSEGLLRRRLRVIAVDESREMLKEARKKLGGNRAIEFRVGRVGRVGRAERIPIESRTMDYVFANMLLHHLDSPPAAVVEMARTLRAEGTMVITDLKEHNFDFLRTEQHDKWMGFGAGEVKRWLEEAGLVSVSVTDICESCCATSDAGAKAEVPIFAAVGKKPARSQSN